MKKNEVIKINHFLFFIWICFFIIPNLSVKYFKFFYLISQEILIISDLGIIKYEPSDNSYTIILQYNLIFSEAELDFISFEQSPSEEGGYIFCRLKNNIFIFDENLDFLEKLEVNEINNYYCIMNIYTSSEGKLSLSISYINDIQNLRLLMFQININDENNRVVSINNVAQEVINQETNTLEKALDKKISCELILKSQFSNKLLTCFAIEEKSFSIIASIFNPENNLEFLSFSQNSLKIDIFSSLNSVISSNKKIILICYIDSTSFLKCLTYNSDKNIFNSLIKIQRICNKNSFYMGVNYINEKQEYIVFCYYITLMNLIRLDTNYKPKVVENNVQCYSLTDTYGGELYTYYSFHIIYNKNDKEYYLLKTGHKDNDDIFFLVTISNRCS